MDKQELIQKLDALAEDIKQDFPYAAVVLLGLCGCMHVGLEGRMAAYLRPFMDRIVIAAKMRLSNFSPKELDDAATAVRADDEFWSDDALDWNEVWNEIRDDL